MARGRGGSGRGRNGNPPTGRSIEPAPRRSARNNTSRVTRSGSTSPTICGTCSSSAAPVGDSGLGCDRCDLWFHPTPHCTGLTASALDCIRSDGGTAILFVCCSCRVTSPNASANSSTGESVASASSALPQLFNMIKSLAEAVAGLTVQVQLSMTSQGLRQGDGPSSSNISPLSHASPSATSSPVFREQFFTEMREFEERKKRRDCIIVRGSAASTEAEFRSEFSGVTQQILGNPVNPTSVQCINPDRGMYRVRIANVQLRDSVLVDAKNLKDSDLYNNVYIARDLTFLQRQDQRSLRARRRATNTVTRVPVGPVSTPSQESQQGPSADADGAGAAADTTQQVPPGASSSEPAAPTPPNL